MSPIRTQHAKPAIGRVDAVLVAVAVLLVGFGVVMVYSASVVEATVVFREPEYFLRRQALYAAGALVVMYVASISDYHRLRPLTYPILAVVTGLMVLSVIGFGHTGGGAARWLSLGPFHVQPSEAAKLSLVLWLAYSLEKKRERVRTFSVGMLPHLMIAAVLMLLCLKQPDFGGAAVLLFLTFTMLFVAGARLGYLLGAAIVGGLFAVWAVRFEEYRWQRMLAWFDMAQHRHDLAYQPYQSVMSFGSGEVTGLGLGRGFQVLYLPEAHTDFISAIIGEELGFIGILGICSVFLVIVARGVRAALRAPDDYGAYLAFGIAVLFGVQALVNLAVALSILPTKGLTLPFISYGGSSLLVSAAGMGILLNISRPRSVSASSGPSRLVPEASSVLVEAAETAGAAFGPAPRARVSTRRSPAASGSSRSEVHA